MKLTDLSEGKERDLDVPWGASGVLKVRYVPERLTAGKAQELAENYDALRLAQVLEAVMTWWDVQEEEFVPVRDEATGEPVLDDRRQPVLERTGREVDVPPTVPNLMRVGVRALGAIYNAMEKDSTPTGEASGSFGSG